MVAILEYSIRYAELDSAAYFSLSLVCTAIVSFSKLAGAEATFAAIQNDAQRQKDEAAKAEAQRRREAQEALLRQPKLAFPDAKGKLAFPAQGTIVRRFGEPDGLGRDSQGLMLATRPGAQVTTPAASVTPTSATTL